MKKFLSLFFSALFFCFSASAEPQIKARHGAIYVEKATSEELEKLFSDYGFVDFGQRDLKVPRIYVKTLPTDWNELEKSDDKDRLFIRILLPLILKINEEIELQKAPILLLKQKAENGEELTQKEKQFIEDKAVEYDIFSRNKDEARYTILLRELAERMGELPPAFLISLAGVFSDWGNSRLAVEANSLYREEIWYSNEGIAPEGVENAEFTYRKFSSLEDCLRSYIHKINSDITYLFVWAARSQSEAIGRKVLGEQIIAAMAYEGRMKNIAGMLDFNLSYYKLNKTDINPSLEDIK